MISIFLICRYNDKLWIIKFEKLLFKCHYDYNDTCVRIYLLEWKMEWMTNGKRDQRKDNNTMSQNQKGWKRNKNCGKRWMRVSQAKTARRKVNFSYVSNSNIIEWLFLMGRETVQSMGFLAMFGGTRKNSEQVEW